MTDDNDPNEIEIEQGTELPEGAPDDFWTRLALALKTTNADVLAGAAATFCGIYKTAHEYVCVSIGYELPAHLEWLTSFLLAKVSPAALLSAYERGKVAVWVVAIDADRVMVFEAYREGARDYTVPRENERLTVYLEGAGNDE